MADEKKAGVAESAVETAQEGGRKALKVIVWLVLLGALGYFVFMIFIGSDPRRDYETPAETLQAYSGLVGSYTGGNQARPDSHTVGLILDFYDSGSRDFFEENKRQMARYRLQFDPVRDISQLSNSATRSEAMMYLLEYPPLNGIATIDQQQNETPDRVQITARTRGLESRTFFMEERHGIWYIMNLGGRMEDIVAELEEFVEGNPETATPEPL